MPALQMQIYGRCGIMSILAVFFVCLCSPQINPDRSVTFRIHAPKAVKVEVTGDCIASDNGGWGRAELAEGKDGVWSLTTGPLEPELYSYAFVVDGLQMLDPSNVFLMRDVRSLMNIFTSRYRLQGMVRLSGPGDAAQDDCIHPCRI